MSLILSGALDTDLYFVLLNESSQGSIMRMGVTLLETENKLKIVMLKDINIITIYNSASCLLVGPTDDILECCR